MQSVALRIICERDNEISIFEPQEYWSIEALIGREGTVPFKAKLHLRDGEKPEIGSGEEAEKIVAELRAQSFVVGEVKKRDQSRRPSPPFTTSTLQQECARRLRFSVKRTMAVAQQLYEGIEVEGETRGLITYMRTDSVHLSEQAITAARSCVSDKYGADHLSPQPRQYTTKSRNAQEAHEAIRPAGSSFRTPAESGLKGLDLSLYELIWKRAVACQMSDAKGERPITRPISPLEVGTTIAELCGIGAKRRAEMKVLDGGSVISELL